MRTRLSIWVLAWVLSTASIRADELSTELSRGCSSHCSLVRGEFGCWERTRAFFEHSLLGQMRNFVAGMAGKAGWLSAQQQSVDWAALQHESVDRLSARAGREKHSSLQPEERHFFEQVVQALANDAKALASAAPSDPVRPHCPLGCERPSDAFFWLFAGSAGLTLALFAALAWLVYLLDYRGARYAPVALEMPAKRQFRESERIRRRQTGAGAGAGGAAGAGAAQPGVEQTTH